MGARKVRCQMSALVSYIGPSSRHRFTATLLDQLLMSSFKMPHRTLNAYIEQFSGFFPSDGRRFVEEETRNGNYRRTPIVPLGFSEIRHGTLNPRLLWLLKQLIASY